jgi:hypothetical protein
MSDFSFSLMDGEEMVLGVAEIASSSDVGAPDARDAVHASSKRRIGISNRRVMIDEETPDRTIIVPNDEVVGVVLKKNTFMSETQLSLVALEMKNGGRIEVGLSFLPLDDEARLKRLFPNARFDGA